MATLVTLEVLEDLERISYTGEENNSQPSIRSLGQAGLTPRGQIFPGTLVNMKISPVAVLVIFAILASVLVLARTRLPSSYINLAHLASHAKTGDIILFQYHTPGPSRLVSTMSHVGIVERRGRHLYIWEAHAKGDADYLDVETGGVHIHPLAPRLKGYSGITTWAPVRRPLTPAETVNLQAFLREMHGTAFDDKHTSRYVAECLLGMPSKPPSSSVFCSEFVAMAFDAVFGRRRARSTTCYTPDQVIDPMTHQPPRQIIFLA